MKSLSKWVLSTLLVGGILLGSANVALADGTNFAQKDLPNIYAPENKTHKLALLDDKANTNVALAKLDNGKIVFMTKKDGKMQQFYPLAVETGFWDTRKENQETNWDEAFKQMKSMGFNTVQLMVQWSDWNQAPGKFDYSYLDSIVNTAKKYDMKMYFAMFFHYQWNMAKKFDDFWAYHVEDHDGKSYSIQWGKGDQNNPANIRKDSLEVFPEYWHPQIYPRLLEAIENLAQHYRDSDTVIAYQLGNEEGFNYYLNGGNDQNPYYQMLFNKWKEQTKQSDEKAFRKDTILALWQSFSDAVHKVDPYKPVTTNFQAGLPEKGGTFDWHEGVDPAFYKEANLDMVGTMFYGNDGDLAWNSLDKIYNYTTQGPILFPSEIGAAGQNSINMKSYVLDSLSRGAQGFGIYCYGEMWGTEHQTNATNLLAMISANQDLITRGLPQATDQGQITLQQPEGLTSRALQVPNAKLFMLNDATVLKKLPQATAKEYELPLKFNQTGRYEVTVMVNGKKQDSKIVTDGQTSLKVSLTPYDVAFVSVQKTAN